MSSSKLRIMHSYYLPEPVWSEILKRLPVKYVLRCRSVQKSWYHLVKTPMFITLHSDHHKALVEHDSDHPKFLFFLNMRDHLLTIRFDDVQCEEYATVKYPLGLPNHAWYALANGLICVSSMFNNSGCLYNLDRWHDLLSHGPTHPSWIINRGLDYDPDIYLWNPLVQKYKTLPASPVRESTSRVTCWKALAFRFLPEFNDYAVVHIVKPRSTRRSQAERHSVMIGVYSLNTNSWKRIRRENVLISSIHRKSAVFVGGAAYWIGVDMSPKKNIIMCFDTKTDILRKIKFPETKYTVTIIHPFGQSIACFVQNSGLLCWKC